MQDCDQHDYLKTDNPVQVDCSASNHISNISYQQGSPVRNASHKQVRMRLRHVNAKFQSHPWQLQSRQLEISSKLPDAPWCGPNSAQVSCTTHSSSAATFVGSLEAHAGEFTSNFTTSKPGATTAGLEFSGRSARRSNTMHAQLSVFKQCFDACLTLIQCAGHTHSS